jgi:gliding motility-associated-like protein
VVSKAVMVFLVLLNANVYLFAQASVSVCAGQKSIKYQVVGNTGSVFHWTVEGGQIISDPYANTITVNWGYNPGYYTISVYEQNVNGCLGNTKKMNVELKTSPLFSFGNNKSFCEGGQTELIADPGTDSTLNRYLWQDGSTNTTFMAKNSGIYWAEVTNQYGCSFRDSIILSVNPLPEINLGKDTMLCAPNELVLDAGNDGSFYNWSTGANSQSVIAYENDGKIWVVVTDGNGCSGSDTIQILRCINHNNLIIPKAFTPNQGTANLWIIGGAEYYPTITVKIYDRWGIQVFESKKGYPEPWDGTSKGKELPMDAYYYIINPGDGSKEIAGSVTIIR